MTQPLGGAVRSAEDRGLGQDLGLRGGRGQRGGLHDAAEHGLAGARIQQMVSRTAVAADPAAA
jgi:hypothetical protein